MPENEVKRCLVHSLSYWSHKTLESNMSPGLNRIRTPHQVHLACASGYSRPVVEGHSATLLARGADQLRSKGLEGAGIQMGMTVMAHNGAVLVRIHQERLSKRGQKFRRLLGLKRHNIMQINDQKN